MAASSNNLKIKVMKMFEQMDAVDAVKSGLVAMGLGHLTVELITDAGEDSNEVAVKVTYADGPFGYQMEMLDRYFSLELFMMYFKSRRNYLMLTTAEQEVIFNQGIHPEVWESNTIANAFVDSDF